MPYSPKQAAVILEADARWNVLCGAVRSGKSFVSYDLLLRRLVELPEGDRVILGRSQQAVERNVLGPMRRRLGGDIVGRTDSRGAVEIAGKPFYVLGAANRSAAARMQGLGLVYAYGDEMATWHPDVFEMLKSRLSEAGACFDGTTNPEYPGHWLKKGLLDRGDLDVKQWQFTMEDNPALPAAYVENLKKEYAGVLYERYILGRWVRAEGVIYGVFADGCEAFLTSAPRYDFVQVGVDFGGNKSAFAFVACGITRDCGVLTALASERHPAAGVTPEEMYRLLEGFLDAVQKRYGPVALVYADNAEQTLINGIRARIRVPVRNSIKNPIMDRVRAMCSLLAQGRFYYTADCESLRQALVGAVYDPKKLGDARLDDGSCDVDTLDAFEYAWERHMRGYMRGGG